MTAVLTKISKEWHQEQDLRVVYVFCGLGMYCVESLFAPCDAANCPTAGSEM
jgi:hypothetical protein